jgi:hypothetical protein
MERTGLLKTSAPKNRTVWHLKDLIGLNFRVVKSKKTAAIVRKFKRLKIQSHGK